MSKKKELHACLALDGGGIRGTLELDYLQELEKRTGKKVHELFKTIVGTSTGSLVALLLTVPGKDGKVASTSEALKIYKEWSPQIFCSKRFFSHRFVVGYFIVSLLAGIFLLVVLSNNPEQFETFAYIVYAIFILTCIISLTSLCCLFCCNPTIQRWISINFGSKYFLICYFFFSLAAAIGLPFVFNQENADALTFWFGIFLCITCALSCYFVFRYLAKPKYSPEGMIKFCDEHFGDDKTLKDAKTTVGITTTDLDNERSFVFNSMRAKLDPKCKLHNAKINLIARATSAAPSYYPPVVFTGLTERENVSNEITHWSSIEKTSKYDKETKVFEDGGTKANNPSLYCLELAESQLKLEGKNLDEYDIKLVSIGTGTLSGKQESIWKYKSKSRSICSYLSPFFVCKAIFNLFYCIFCYGRIDSPDGGIDHVLVRQLGKDVFNVTQNAHSVHYLVENKFREQGKEDFYQRVQFKVTKSQLKEMDDYSKQNMDSLFLSAQDAVEEHIGKTLALLGEKNFNQNHKQEIPLEVIRDKSRRGRDYKKTKLEVEEPFLGDEKENKGSHFHQPDQWNR